MLRAMDSAVAGLRAHQNKLDVIGHNIANVNTAGYKSQSYMFKEAMYQTSTTSTSGSGSTGGSGGVNAAQYGYGTMMGSIAVDMTASTPTQMSGLTATIDGEGFFMTLASVINAGIVQTGVATTDSDTLKSNNFQYTRVGQFKIDSDGYLVDSNSNNFIYGYRNAGNAFDSNDFNMGKLEAIRICNVSGAITNDQDDVALANSVKIDNEGKIIVGIKVEVPVLDENGQQKTETVDVPVTDANGRALYNGGTVYRDAAGNYYNVADDSPYDVTQGVTPDMTTETRNVTQTVIEEAVIGRVAIATFQNQEGLTKSGGSYYTASRTDNSGLCAASAPGTDGSASLITGYVEASNVDMAKEFSELITTQRGFQANSKIITVSDQILEELVNMKR